MPNQKTLSGRRALITGASSGLGEHFAKTLAKHGAEVVLAARRLDRLEGVKTAIEAAGGTALAVEMDVTEVSSVEAAFSTIAGALDQPCDILINNSGVGQESWMIDTEEDEWANIVDTNLTGVWRVAKYAGRAMIDGKVSGSIVNIASITALRPSYMLAGYAATKAGVDQLTRNMALEFARFGIRVNAIAPGYFKTSINDTFLESENGDRMRKRVAMRRFGEYQELDGALLLLASDAGSYMTGSTIVVDGGHTLTPL
jgi:NAD(P)-dependent dehydrogenase (short-subunit alcohol dehydrogenase family)